MESPHEHPLRFGIMCDGETLQQWQIECLRELLALGNVTLALIIMRDPRSPRSPEVRLHQTFYRIFSRLLVRPHVRRAISIRSLLSTVATMSCGVTVRDRFSQYFKPDDIQKIRGFNLDFILRLGFGILRGDVLKAARYGIWSFHHDDEKKYRGRPACLWEIYYDDRVTGAVLQRLTERLDAGILLKKGYFKTVRYSYAKNLDVVLSESARWPAQVCIDIRNGFADYLTAAPSTTAARIFYRPSNLQTCLLASKIVKRRLEAAYRLLFRYTTWNVGIVESPIHAFLKPGFRPGVRWLPQPRRAQIQADPFGRVNGGKLDVLFEKLDYLHRKGIICAVELEDGNQPSEPKIAIELPVHMSYPYLFEHDGGIYCIPETNQARKTCVYKAEEFPYHWVKVAEILENVRAIDPTIFRHKGGWWLTCTDRERGGDANLYVWYAPEVWGPWKPHPLNPVKTDIRSARPGGTPFEYDGNLYRPAQDCSRTGGGRIIINRVEKLTPTDFHEEAVAVVEPYKDTHYREGLHTLSSAGSFTLIDGKRFKFLPSGLLTNLVKGLKTLTGRGREVPQLEG